MKETAKTRALAAIRGRVANLAAHLESSVSMLHLSRADWEALGDAELADLVGLGYSVDGGAPAQLGQPATPRRYFVTVDARRFELVR